MTGAGGFEADAAALGQAAKGIDDLLDGLSDLGGRYAAGAGRGLDGLRLAADQVGHGGLAEALSGFIDRWQWGVRGLVQSGRDVADKLHQTGIDYRHADITAEGLLKRVIVDAVGDPHADPSNAETESWSQLMHDTGGQDYSGQSFQKLAEDAGQTWSNELRDVEGGPFGIFDGFTSSPGDGKQGQQGH